MMNEEEFEEHKMDDFEEYDDEGKIKNILKWLSEQKEKKTIEINFGNKVVQISS